ncbi:MAG: hypothetical protein R3F17_02020 [Planctomycetota bacterium]
MFRFRLPLPLAWILLLLSPFATLGVAQEELLEVGEGLEFGPDGAVALVWGPRGWQVRGELFWGTVGSLGPDGLDPDAIEPNQSHRILPGKAGQEIAYRRPEGGWGWVRVIEAQAAGDWVRIEHLTLEAGARLQPGPKLELEVAAEPDGYRLHWWTDGAFPCRVMRRVVGSPEAALELGTTDTGGWFDDLAPPGVMLEYSVTPLRDGPVPATRRRALRQERPESQGTQLEDGLGIDLLTGAIQPLEADVEVSQISGERILLRASEKCPLMVSGGGADEFSNWLAPRLENGGFHHGIRPVTADNWVYFCRVDQGVRGRLRFERTENGGWVMHRSIDWAGDGWLPLAPRLHGNQFTGSALNLSFEPLKLPEWYEGELPERIIEVDRFPGAGEWTVIARDSAVVQGQSLTFDLPADRLPLVSLRFRHRMLGGNVSPPSAPVSLIAFDVSDGDRLVTFQRGALTALESESFSDRLLGEQMLRALGPAAWPTLLELYERGEGVQADLARQMLLTPEGVAGGQLQGVLRIAGQREGLEGALPGPWCDPDARMRILALLTDAQLAERAPWLDLLARLDPDARVRDLANVLGDGTLEPMIAPGPANEGIAARIPPADRHDPLHLDWARELDGASRADAGAILRQAADAWHFDPGLALLALANEAESSVPEFGQRVFLENVLLGLGLLDRYAQEPRPVLLRAILEGLVRPSSELRAWRDLWQVRNRATLAGSPRRVLHLEQPSLGALQSLLRELEMNGDGYVDVILPAGEYGNDDSGDHWIEVGVPGLALLGEGDVHVHAGIQAASLPDLVVADLTLEHASGNAVSLASSTMTLRRVTLIASQTPLSLTESAVELDQCRLIQGDGKESYLAMRMIGVCSLSARATHFAAGTLVLGDQGKAYLDRCLLDGADRVLAQGQRGGNLVLRECVLLGGSSGVQGLDTLVIERPVRPGRRSLWRWNANAADLFSALARPVPAGSWAGDRVLGACPLLERH